MFVYSGEPSLGVPGIPGAADLEAALRRLTPAEIKARRAKLAAGQHFNQYDCDGNHFAHSFLSVTNCKFNFNK